MDDIWIISWFNHTAFDANPIWKSPILLSRCRAPESATVFRVVTHYPMLQTSPKIVYCSESFDCNWVHLSTGGGGIGKPLREGGSQMPRVRSTFQKKKNE